MKLTLLLLLAPLAAQDVGGRYVLENVMEIASELLLLPNHSFSYVLTSGDADYYATGTWAVDGDSVVLNSKVASAPQFRFVRSEAVQGGSGIHAWVKSSTGEPAENVDVQLQQNQGGALQAKTNDRGEAVFTGAGAPRTLILSVRTYGVQGGPFPVNPEHNNFYFEINWEAITRVPFRNERLKINGKSLELRFWNTKTPLNYTVE